MLTTSHACIGYLLFEKKSRQERWLAVLGSVIPDAVFFVVLPWLLVFNFSEVQTSIQNHTDIYASSVDFHIGQVLNSIWLWIFIIILSKKWSWLFPIGVAGLVHIIVDALTHKGSWGWNHFYPMPMEPLQGVLDFSQPQLFVPMHIIWIVIFGMKFYRYRQSQKMINKYG